MNKIVLVCGPVSGGKTAYVRSQTVGGDLSIEEALSSQTLRFIRSHWEKNPGSTVYLTLTTPGDVEADAVACNYGGNS